MTVAYGEHPKEITFTTYFKSGQSKDADVYGVLLVGESWTAKPGSRYIMNLLLGSTSIDMPAIGFNASKGKGVGAHVDGAKLLSSMSIYDSMAVMLDGKAIESLDIADASQAVSIFRRCIREKKDAEATARGRAWREALPDDPFSNP